jgi:sulfonate dioxygenase
VFLKEHLHSADDLTVRWKWEPGSVAFWDNRLVAHRAVPGGYNPEEREEKRTYVYGEKPRFDGVNGLRLSEYLPSAKNTIDSGVADKEDKADSPMEVESNANMGP